MDYLTFRIIELISYIIVIPGFIFAFFAQIRVKCVYKKYSKHNASSGWVADEMAHMLLEKANCPDVNVEPISGKLTDNYNPTTNTISLSEGVYGSSSISALGVTAHECGHAIQHETNYFPFRFRSFMVKVVNIGSTLAIPLAIIGVIVSLIAENTSIGKYIVFFAIIAYSLTALFALITLPVELNASRRAKKLLVETGVLDKKEMRGVRSVLNAAAWTYIASLAVALLYLLRFIVILLSLVGNKKN